MQNRGAIAPFRFTCEKKCKAIAAVKNYCHRGAITITRCDRKQQSSMRDATAAPRHHSTAQSQPLEETVVSDAEEEAVIAKVAEVS